jgi:hypothetical protein
MFSMLLSDAYMHAHMHAEDDYNDSEYTYEEVAIEEDFESEEDAGSEDLEATLRSLQKLSFFLGNEPDSCMIHVYSSIFGK